MVTSMPTDEEFKQAVEKLSVTDQNTTMSHIVFKLMPYALAGRIPTDAELDDIVSASDMFRDDVKVYLEFVLRDVVGQARGLER